ELFRLTRSPMELSLVPLPASSMFEVLSRGRPQRPAISALDAGPCGWLRRSRTRRQDGADEFLGNVGGGPLSLAQGVSLGEPDRLDVGAQVAAAGRAIRQVGIERPTTLREQAPRRVVIQELNDLPARQPRVPRPRTQPGPPRRHEPPSAWMPA